VKQWILRTHTSMTVILAGSVLLARTTLQLNIVHLNGFCQHHLTTGWYQWSRSIVRYLKDSILLMGVQFHICDISDTYFSWQSSFIKLQLDKRMCCCMPKSTAVLPVALGHASVVMFIVIRLLNFVILKCYSCPNSVVKGKLVPAADQFQFNF